MTYRFKSFAKTTRFLSGDIFAQRILAGISSFVIRVNREDILRIGERRPRQTQKGYRIKKCFYIHILSIVCYSPQKYKLSVKNISYFRDQYTVIYYIM